MFGLLEMFISFTNDYKGRGLEEKVYYNVIFINLVSSMSWMFNILNLIAT